MLDVVPTERDFFVGSEEFSSSPFVWKFYIVIIFESRKP